MRKIAFFVLLAAAAAVFVPVAADAARRPPKRDEKKKELTPQEKAQLCYGKIRIVNSSLDADFLVAVGPGADIEIKIVPYFADAPGKWQLVNSGEKYKVFLVHGCGDFSAKFVNHEFLIP